MYDANDKMVSDKEGVIGTIITRIRGWGRIQYMDKPEQRAAQLQDEVGKMVAEALTQFWHPQGPAEHWHRLYREECQKHKDHVARLGAEIESLEASVQSYEAEHYNNQINIGNEGE